MSKTLSIIDQEMSVDGLLFTTGTLDVTNGKVHGTIIARNLIVKGSANITGKIFVLESLICEGGQIVGEIIASSIKIMKNATLSGSMTYTKISIEDGATIIGDVKKVAQDTVQSIIQERYNANLQNSSEATEVIGE